MLKGTFSTALDATSSATTDQIEVLGIHIYRSG